MPYKSDAQRRFFHTNTAKKAGITEDEVNEFDKASKGMKLPEKAKKMAYGGETNAKHETLKSMENNPTAGFKDGGEVKESPIIEWLRSKIMGAPINADNADANGAMGVDTSSGTAHMSDGGDVKHMPQKDSDYGTLVGLRALLEKASNGEDVHEEKPQPIDTGDGKFMGEYEVGVSTPVKHYDQGTGDVSPYPLNDQGIIDLPEISGGPQDTSLPQPGQNFDISTGVPSTAPINLQGIPASMPAGLQTPPPQPAPQMAPQGGQPMPQGGVPIHQMMQTMNQTPATNYDFYKNMTAEDRAALLQKLTQQQHSGGNLIASGAAGLGDAIARSFGHQNTNYQQGVEEKAQKAKEEAVQGVDTERQQKLQDVEANYQVQSQDPNSAVSAGMRAIGKQLLGKELPPTVSASMLEKMMGPATDVFKAKLEAGIQGDKNSIDALKSVLGESWWDQVKDAFSPERRAALEKLTTQGGVSSGTNISLPSVGQSVQHTSGATITRTN